MMRTRRLLLAALFVAATSILPGVASAQWAGNYIGIADSSGPITGSNPLPVSGTFSASLSGFQPSASGAYGTPISVTSSGVTGTLPTGAVVVATNTGSNIAYCELGASATTSGQPIAASGGWFAWTVGLATQLTCITSTSTTTVNMVGGSGLPTGTGGGGGSGGGGNVNLNQVGGASYALGQTTMSASMPVTIASNQSAVPASESGTWNVGLSAGTNVVGGVELVDSGGTNKAAINSSGAQSVNLTYMGTTALGAPSNYGTSPGAVEVQEIGRASCRERV